MAASCSEYPRGSAKASPSLRLRSSLILLDRGYNPASGERLARGTGKNDEHTIDRSFSAASSLLSSVVVASELRLVSLVWQVASVASVLDPLSLHDIIWRRTGRRTLRDKACHDSALARIVSASASSSASMGSFRFGFARRGFVGKPCASTQPTVCLCESDQPKVVSLVM